MAIDFNRAPEAILVDMINQTNGSTLTPESVFFGVPEVVPGVSPVRNTQITVTARPSLTVSGQQVITYDRVSLADVPGSRSKLFARGLASRVSQLIPSINAAYGILLTDADYLDEALPLPKFSGEIVSFALVAAPNSLVYRGSVVLKTQRPAQQLGDVLSVLSMNGLGYPSL
jgi:hypothetical protein